MIDSEPDDVWVRLRWAPWRLPRNFPSVRHPFRLLAGVLKHAGRYCGWQVMEMFPAGAGLPGQRRTAADGPGAAQAHVEGRDAPGRECASLEAIPFTEEV